MRCHDLYVRHFCTLHYLITMYSTDSGSISEKKVIKYEWRKYKKYPYPILQPIIIQFSTINITYLSVCQSSNLDSMGKGMKRLSVLQKLSLHFLPTLYNTTANLCMCSGVVKLDWKTSPILWYHHCKTKCLEREEKHLLIAYLLFWHEWYCLVEYHGISENNNTRISIPVNLILY